MAEKTKILIVEKEYIVAFKESGMATVPLKNERGEPSLLSFVASAFPEVIDVRGKNEWEGGVLHRLDTPTSGLVLIARDQSFYSKMISEQEKGCFIKRYKAKTVDLSSPLDGFPPFDIPLKEGSVIESKFRAYGVGRKAVRPLIESQYLYGKTDPVYYTYIEKIEGHTFSLMLKKGFRHQIRSHLSWASHPIDGDVLYGAKESSSFGLLSYELEFLGERISIYS